eukprot:1984851-Pyramimonas_sp.AAC.1
MANGHTPSKHAQEHNYTINPTKNETVVAVFGAGSKYVHQQLRSGALPTADKANDPAPMFGGILRAGSFFQSELPCRASAVDSGYAAMGRY